MENYHQMTIQDAMFQQTVDKLPKRLAYIDETGSFGFDFSTEGASKYYILTAIVVEIDKLKKLHTDFEEIKKQMVWLRRNLSQVRFRKDGENE